MIHTIYHTRIVLNLVSIPFVLFINKHQDRKGIRLQFRNLLGIRLYMSSCMTMQSRQREIFMEMPSGGIGRVFFSVLQLYSPWKSFIERYGVINW